MPDSAILEKTSQPSGKVNFTLVSPPRENATEGESYMNMGLMMS